MKYKTDVTKEEVAGWFYEDVSVLKGATILFGCYNRGDYEGDAFVLFRRGGKLYEVNGSHCSCYELEDQWSPEQTSYEQLRKRSEGGYFSLPDDLWPQIKRYKLAK